MPLKDNIQEEVNMTKSTENKDGMSTFRGELEIWALKNGEVFHHEKQHNIVTKWAKHATMHLLTSESFSTHGDREVNGANVFASRSENDLDHTDDVNNDGTMISNEQYLGDNAAFYDSGDARYKYWTVPNPDITPVGDSGDDVSEPFKYPFFPTKMLFGTGIEYANWQEIIDAGRDGTGQDGYGHVSNGGWTETTFNNSLIEDGTTSPVDTTNYYSTRWDGTAHELVKTRTVNDIYASSLTEDENPMTEDNYGVKGAVKNSTYDGLNGDTGNNVLTTNDGKEFASGEYRGIGRPAFIYATRLYRYMQSGSVLLEYGETSETNTLESKITFTITMPTQESGEYYPYNGYTIKVAGLFADAAMCLSNDIPNGPTVNEDVIGEYDNYMKMPAGIMWATRNIAPIYKSHDTEIVAQWSIYL